MANEKEVLLIVRKKLLEKGFTINSWAKSCGYNINHAKKCIYRYSERQRLPQGCTTYKILLKLHEDTGLDLTKKVS